MNKAKVTFYKIIQNSQDYGIDDEHMVSRIFFNLEIEGEEYKNLFVDIKQTVGASFESAPLEVGPPQGYKGPFNHQAFREEVENYYRSSFGERGSEIHIDSIYMKGRTDVRMRNNVVDKEKIVEFEISGKPAGW